MLNAPTHGASYDPVLDWTQLNLPEPDPDLYLMPRSACSFSVNDIQTFAAWIQRGGWRSFPGRSPAEFCRVSRGRALIVLYHSGSVLVQGPRPEETVKLLAQLVRPGGRN